MLFDRRYPPGEGDVVYHYCTAETFHSICSYRTLRFSDLATMNDFMEVHWGYRVWEAAASELLDTVGRDFLDKIDARLATSGLLGTLVASCFSLDGDVLSQWRAYADDGRGYAIGFDAGLLAQLAVSPLRVLYDKAEQVREMKQAILALHRVETEGGMQFGPDFVEACWVLSFDLASFKNPAFSEEQEVRLTHVLSFEPSNNFLKLVDNGGVAFGREVEGVPVKFAMRDSVPTPYIDLDFSSGGAVDPVRTVILGPKNEAKVSAVSVFLETLGIPAVDVARSKASYR